MYWIIFVCTIFKTSRASSENFENFDVFGFGSSQKKNLNFKIKIKKEKERESNEPWLGEKRDGVVTRISG